MTTARAARRLRLMVSLTIFAAGGALGLYSDRAAPPARAAQKVQPKDALKPPTTDHKYIGAAACQQCHNELKPEENPLYMKTLGFEFVRLWENKVWGVHDLHSTAYKNLLTSNSPQVKAGKAAANPTAERMEKNLRRYKGDNYTVATDPGCLACHASLKRPVEQSPVEKWTLDSFDTRDGVGCEMCHGHGSTYRFKHQETDENAPKPEGATDGVGWREWPPSVKREWGLIDLRDPAVATAQCASCHVGNAREGRFVTHEWYAVGHPPLPPLDLVKYTREQPRHWGLPSELPYFDKLLKKDEKKAASVFHVRKDESHVARRFAESTLATLRESANLGDQLGEAGKEDGLDYAAFDCASCHHNLKYPSDRQERGYVGRPGRPLFRPAAFALAKIVTAHAAQMEGSGLKNAPDQLAAAEKKMLEAFASKSLGDPAKIKTAAAELRKWCNDTLTKLAAVRYTPDETKRLLAMVTDATQDPKKPVADPEVAQLYTWAFETLVLDLVPPTKDDKGKLVPPKSVTDLRGKLKGLVVTRLRPELDFDYEVTGGVPGDNLKPVDARIGERMETFNSFRFDSFRKAFQEVKPFPK
jgi:hypothetical protein